MRRVHKMLIVIGLFSLLVLGAVLLLIQKEKPEAIIYGMSFNTLYARELGLDWKETLFAKLNAQVVTEQTVLDNPQQFSDTAITITPQMQQLQTFVSDKGGRNVNRKSLNQMGKLSGQAMMRKNDEAGLVARDGCSMD